MMGGGMMFRALDRLYVSQAQKRLLNLEADKTQAELESGAAWVVVIKDVVAGMADFLATRDRCAALGISVIPSFRLMDGIDFAGWWNEDRWARNAQWFEALKPFAQHGRIALDAEAYQCVSPKQSYAESFAKAGKDPSDVVKVWSPLLKAIDHYGQDIVPCIFPANLDDLITREISHAASSSVELWTEHHYDLVSVARTDPDAADHKALEWAHWRAQAAQRFPWAIVRHGSYEDVRKRWGVAIAHERELDFGPHEPWVYLFSRTAEDKMGSRGWYDGTCWSTTNDVAQAWAFPPLSGKGNYPAVPGGATFKTFAPNLMVAEESPKYFVVAGCRLPNGYGFMATDVLPKVASAFTATLEVVLPPSGCGPVIGACQKNSESWQIVLTETGDLMLELRRASPPKVSVLVASAPLRGVPLRLSVSMTGKAWSWASVQDKRLFVPGSVTLPDGPGPGAGHLYVGSGTIMGTYTPVTLTGLVVSNVELHLRALNSSEVSAVLATPYPRRA
jgi:hypothetical protein